MMTLAHCCRWLLTAMLVLALVLARPLTCHASVVRLTNSAAVAGIPRLNNKGQVVWTGWDGAGWAVYLWTGSVVQRLTDGAIHGGGPDLNDVGQVVWAGWQGNEGNLHI